ncbi:MAG: hypothetical protein ACKVQQ_08515 [Burkholderiales bacterium]
MRLNRKWLVAALAATLSIATPAFAQGNVETPKSRSAMDPALSQALTSLATALALGFAANMAAGSQEGFDPAPVLEKSLRSALGSRQLDQAVDALLASALKSEGGAAMPVELRAALALAAKALFVNLRREALRDLADQGSPQ